MPRNTMINEFAILQAMLGSLMKKTTRKSRINLDDHVLYLLIKKDQSKMPSRVVIK